MILKKKGRIHWRKRGICIYEKCTIYLYQSLVSIAILGVM